MLKSHSQTPSPGKHRNFRSKSTTVDDFKALNFNFKNAIQTPQRGVELGAKQSKPAGNLRIGLKKISTTDVTHLEFVTQRNGNYHNNGGGASARSSARSNKSNTSIHRASPLGLQSRSSHPRRRRKEKNDAPIRLLLNGGSPTPKPSQTKDLFDKDGRMDHKQVRFNCDEMINNPPIFAEPYLDFDEIAVDPSQNPVYIQHALLNKGQYPPSFMNELERFLEDQNTKKAPRQESLGQSLLRLTRICNEERRNLIRMTQKYKLEKNLEKMRFSGKPFYWVDHEKLRKMKQFCEEQTDPTIREKAFAALEEYQSVIEQYNFGARKKILDIFPQHKTSTVGAITGSAFSRYSMDPARDKMVNIQVIDSNTTRQQNESRRTGLPSPTYGKQQRRQSGPKMIMKGTLPWNVQSFLRQKVYIKDKEVLTKIKKVMALRKPKKPSHSHYNQDVLRQQSQAKQREQRDHSRDVAQTAYFGNEFRQQFQTGTKLQYQDPNPLLKTQNFYDQKQHGQTFGGTQNSFFAMRQNRRSLNPSSHKTTTGVQIDNSVSVQHPQQTRLHSPLDLLSSSNRIATDLLSNNGGESSNISKLKRMMTPSQGGKIMQMGLTLRDLQRPPALTLQKSSRVKTVEGRSRPRPNQQQQIEIQQYQAYRQQQQGSRMAGGKRVSLLTNGDQRDEVHDLFKDQQTDGQSPNKVCSSAISSDRSSIMDIPEQNDDLPSAYKGPNVRKFDETQNSGADSTNKDSQFNMTSALAPTSCIDGGLGGPFNSEIDNCTTPKTRKSRMTALSMKHPPQLAHQVHKINRELLSQKRTELMMTPSSRQSNRMQASMLAANKAHARTGAGIIQSQNKNTLSRTRQQLAGDQAEDQEMQKKAMLVYGRFAGFGGNISPDAAELQDEGHQEREEDADKAGVQGRHQEQKEDDLTDRAALTSFQSQKREQANSPAPSEIFSEVKRPHDLVPSKIESSCTETLKVPSQGRARVTMSMTSQKLQAGTVCSPIKLRPVTREFDIYTNFIHSFVNKPSSPVNRSRVGVMHQMSPRGSLGSHVKTRNTMREMTKLQVSTTGFNAQSTFQNRSQTPVIMRQSNEARCTATSVKAGAGKRASPWYKGAFQSQTEQAQSSTQASNAFKASDWQPVLEQQRSQVEHKDQILAVSSEETV